MARMLITYTPLTRHVRDLDPSYALYAIRHEPTMKMYFGSTDNIAQRLMNWYYLFQAKKAQPMPSRMAAVFLQYERNPYDWTYALLKRARPQNYAPRGNSADKPEAPLIQLWANDAPHLLLNDPIGTNHGRPTTARRAPGSWGKYGVSPLRYLNVMLGHYPGFKWASQPPCTKPVDPRELVPVGALDLVPFAEVLRRSMSTPPKHLNPTPAAIDSLYQKWRLAQPAGFDAAVRLPSTITTAEQALALPDPSVWMQHNLAR